MNQNQPYEIQIKVMHSDIDELGHVNNIVYLRWVQDAAVAHWQALASAGHQAQIFWVVLRHEIDYLAPAREGDEIIAATWVGQAKRLSFHRNTEIMRRNDRKLLARAKTFWCPINANTGKPQRVSQEIRDLFSASSL
ncbi:MAG: acyl-CoA thioesterase [Desulfonatronovibrio sp.]